MKKIFLTVLAISVIFGLFSCSSSTEETFDVDFGVVDSENYDFEGYEFKVIGGFHQNYGDSVIGDAVLERYDEVEKKFNIKINYEGIAYGFSGVLLQKTMAGEKYADLMWARLSDMNPCLAMDLLLALNDTGYLDINDEKFGTGSLKETTKFNTENYYGVYPEYWPYMNISLNGQCLISYQVLRENQQPDPYELLENHEWNWANFEKIAEACANPSEGKYGVTTAHDEMLNTVFFQNNVNFVVYNEAAKRWETDFASPAAVNAAEWVSSLIAKGIVFHSQSGDAVSSKTVFEELRSAFHLGPGYYGIGINDIPALTEGFGFIPMAFGDNNPDEIWNCKFDARQEYYCIPNVDTIKTEISLIVLDALLDPIDTGYDWKSYYSRYVFYDENSAKCFIKMVDEASNSGFNMIGRPQLDSFNAIMNGSSPVQKLQSMEGVIQNLIDTAYNYGELGGNLTW